MTADEMELWQRLQEVANRRFDGHLTVMKFTTNWRVSFDTPSDRNAIANMAAGSTFGEAARSALATVEPEDQGDA